MRFATCDGLLLEEEEVHHRPPGYNIQDSVAKMHLVPIHFVARRVDVRHVQRRLIVPMDYHASIHQVVIKTMDIVDQMLMWQVKSV